MSAFWVMGYNVLFVKGSTLNGYLRYTLRVKLTDNWILSRYIVNSNNGIYYATCPSLV
jgi:hypothetical protein